ncbi:hypothetical protein BKD03_07260 [Brucella sp. 09RB8471]|nr:hypothetical protein BKD03_07260 [Brucella sp. 09RB8471]
MHVAHFHAKSNVIADNVVGKWLLDNINSSKRMPANQLNSVVVEITPALAREILDKCNRDNRGLRKARVNLYAKAMSEGRWKLTSQGISLSRDGHLNNGQHRLEAIIASGETVTMLITFGEEREVFDIIDTSASRGPSDILKIAGFKNTAKLAASIRIIMMIESGNAGANITYGVIAFEKMRAQKSLSELEHVSARDVEGFLKAFKAVDEVEAALYHETVRGRLQIIRNYLELVEENALEKVLQRKLFDHLWLLDPSWDRATGTTEMEVSVSTFLKTDKGVCNKAIEDSRMDIVYREFGGTHVVIEMKRPKVDPTVFDLLAQISKYRQGLSAHLKSSYQVQNPFVQTIILLDEEPSDWSDSDEKARQLSLLENSDARVLTYRNLLNKARSVYEQFLRHDGDVARISKLLEKIQQEIAEQKTAVAAE